MDNSSSVLDKWRDYFRGSNSDIFDIIKHAIMVAASDCPNDFKMKRDQIAEILFTCKVTRCFGCDKIELAVPNEINDFKCKSGVEAGGSKDTKESKAKETNFDPVSNDSYGDAEALTDEIEEESQLFDEVLRVKEVLDNWEEETDTTVFDSLRKLQLMPLSVETLKATEIGKSVNSLRKHRSKEIRNLVRTLIEDWRVMVDAWVDATAAIAGAESVKTSVVEEEEGLPSPPLDEGAFFATPTSMELSQFFDGMDDDGNPRSGGELNKNRETSRRPRIEKPDILKPKLENHNDSRTPPKDKIEVHNRNQEVTFKKQPNRNLGVESVPTRPRPAMQSKVKNEIKVQQNTDKSSILKKPMPPQQELNCNNEASVRIKLEVAKRKLQERYQEAENAKKQRTIQVMELHELPKQNLAHRNQNTRPGNHNRNWANGRR